MSYDWLVKKSINIRRRANVFILQFISMMETLKAIDDYEARNTLNDEQRRQMFERRMQIFLRIRQWREEKEQ